MRQDWPTGWHARRGRPPDERRLALRLCGRRADIGSRAAPEPWSRASTIDRNAMRNPLTGCRAATSRRVSTQADEDRLEDEQAEDAGRQQRRATAEPGYEAKQE